MVIWPATPMDEGAFVAIAAAAGLVSPPACTRFALGHMDMNAFLCRVDGEPIGTGMVADYGGSTGWIGMITVLPAHQRQGFGHELMAFAEEILWAKGVKTIILSASAAGKPLYDQLGYTTGVGYAAYSGPGITSPPKAADTHLRRLTAADWPLVADLDFAVTGERRMAVLRCLPLGYGVDDGAGGLRGFVLPTPWGTGAAVALDPEAGRLLIDQVRYCAGSPEVRIHTTDANRDAVAYLESIGFTRVRSNTRMWKGEPPKPLQAERLWGMLSSGLG